MSFGVANPEERKFTTDRQVIANPLLWRKKVN